MRAHHQPSLAMTIIVHLFSCHCPRFNAGCVKASHAMQEWGAALEGAVVVDRCLPIAPGMGQGLPDALKGPLFVRPCYEKLWQKELKPMLGPGEPSACVTTCACTGTSGISKNKFAVWIMKQLAAAGAARVLSNSHRSWHSMAQVGLLQLPGQCDLHFRQQSVS